MMAKKENIWALLSATSFLLLSGCVTTSYTTREVVSYDGAHYVVGQCSLTEEDSSSIKQQAEDGDAEAQFNLGAWYDSSCGGHDTSEGAKWFLRAAEQGNRQAQYKIAGRYFNGIGATEDIEEVERWYRKAAEQGDAVAARTLGDLYNIFNYKPRDLDEAEKWYRLAIKNGDSFSLNRLDQLMRQKDPEAWTEEKRETKEKLRLAAEAKAERIRLEVEAKTRVTAREAIARFGLVSVSVIEEEESNRYRAEVRKKLESLPELREDVAEESEDNSLGLLLQGILSIPLAGPLAIIGPLMEESTFDSEQYSYQAFRQWAKDRAAIATATCRYRPRPE